MTDLTSPSSLPLPRLSPPVGRRLTSGRQAGSEYKLANSLALLSTMTRSQTPHTVEPFPLPVITSCILGNEGAGAGRPGSRLISIPSPRFPSAPQRPSSAGVRPAARSHPSGWLLVAGCRRSVLHMSGRAGRARWLSTQTAAWPRGIERERGLSSIDKKYCIVTQPS